jgi:NAD(P)-dependent dehydrogenase (short-subunit alcohol dehydrogenase family)
MDLGLAGRTALITGASKGIGRATAEEFAAEGCHLHLVARTKADLDAARDAIRTRWNVNIAVHPVDLSNGDACRTLAAEVGDVDILVNNAGAIPGGDIAAVEEERWRKAWDLKVFGYINLTRAIYPKMRARGRGVIVNIIGLAGELLNANYVAGTTGNAALMAFSRALGADSFDSGVRVVGINPGMVATDRLRTLYETRAQKEFGDKSRWKEFMKELPQGRAAEARDVADAAVFLASDRASYISGTVLTIDGGSANRRAG